MPPPPCVLIDTYLLQDEAQSAIDLNNTKFKSRILHVSLSTTNPAKRQATTLINSRNSASPPLDSTNHDSAAVSPKSAASPSSSAASQTKPTRDEIASRTVALLNVPDTINDARIRALMEQYGPLNKIVLRPDHQGAIVEFANVNDAGKAALAVDGHEIVPDRKLAVGSVPDMLAQKAEQRSKQTLKPAAPVRRPGQPTTGRKGGLGRKVGQKSAGDNPSSGETGGGGGTKTNADFKAMFVKETGNT